MPDHKPAPKAQADCIIAAHAEGMPLRAICRATRAELALRLRVDITEIPEWMPAFRTAYNWMDSDPDFAARFARARESAKAFVADEMVEIADTRMEGATVTVIETGTGDEKRVERRVTTEDQVHHRRLRLWAREKLLSIWATAGGGAASSTARDVELWKEAAATMPGEDDGGI